MIRKIFIGWCLFLVFQQVFSQNIPFIFSYTTSDGLNSNSISKLFQDDQGFIWIATNDGLQRFDGYQFNNFTPKYLKNALRYISVMQQDFEGNYYIGTNSHGLIIMDKSLKEFRHFNSSKGDSNSISNSLIEDFLFYNKQVLIATYDGINFFDPKENTFQVYRPFGYSDQPENWIVSLHPLNDTSMIACNKTGQVFLFNPKTKKYFIIKSFKNKRLVSSILKYPDLWIGTEDDLIRFNLMNNTHSIYSDYKQNTNYISGKQISDITLDNDSNVWISTFRGTNIFNYEKNKMHYLLPEDNPYQINDISIRCLLADNMNGIWIGTSQGGVNYIPGIQKPFHNIVKNSSNNLLASNEIFSICSDKKGNTWVGTLNGVSGFDKNMQKRWQFQYIYPDHNIKESRYFPDFIENETIWIGTGEGYVIQYQPYTNKSKAISVSPGKKSTVTAICKGKEGKYYFRIYSKGIFEYDSNTNKAIKLLDEKGPEAKISALSGGGLVYLHDKLYIGTTKGLDVYNTLEKTIENDIFQDQQSIIDMHVQGRVIWIALKEKLVKFDAINRNNTFFSVEELEKKNVNDFMRESISSFTIDKNNNFWLGTSSKELIRYNPATEKHREFVVEEGIGNSMIRRIHCREDGIIVYGGVNGITWFHPDSVETIVPIANLVISKVQTEEDTIFISDNTELLLKNGNRTIQFSFSLLDYATTKYTCYDYFLEGLDKDWKTTQRNEVSYYDIPPGQYCFKLKAKNYVGEYILSDAFQLITVVPEFYETWWFRLSTFFVLPSIFGLLVLLFIPIIKKKRKVVNKIIISSKEQIKKTDFKQLAADNIHKNITNTEFDVNVLAQEMGYSSSSFYKKMKEELDTTPHDFITSVKMEYAASLLKQKQYNISEIAIQTGYSDIAVFSRNFKKYFGVSPSKYQ